MNGYLKYGKELSSSLWAMLLVFASDQARKTSQPNTVTASANCEWRICQPIQSAWFYGNRSTTMAQVHNVENVLSHQTSTPEYLKRYRGA